METITCIKGTNVRLKYYQNDDIDKAISITEDDDVTPVDLTGKTLLMQIKDYRSDTTPRAELTLGSGLTLGGVDNNSITLSGAYDLESGPYYYDLRNTDDSVTLIYGQFIVTGDVSK